MKKILILLAVSLAASNALATCDEAPKVTLGGYIDTQAGYVIEKKPFQHIDPSNPSSPKRDNYGIVNDTKIDIKAEGKSHYGFKYGMRVRLNADTSKDASDNDDNVADKTMMFIESDKYGRFEGGAYDSASRIMQVSAITISASPGSIDGYQQKWFNGKNIDGTSYANKFIKWPELLTNCDCISFSNKVTYYTPKFSGIQIGVSFSPDNAVHGTVSKLKTIPQDEDQNFKNLVDYGVTYENKVNDVEVKVGFTGQYAKSKSLTIARTNLNSWELGANLTYKSFSLGGSYSDWNKSATPVIKDPNKKYGAGYWTLGAGYRYSDFYTSLTYFRGKRANVYTSGIPATTASHDVGFNRNEYISLSSEYKLAPGFMPYAEVTRFRAKLYGSSPNNSGYVILAGSRLTF
jgi:hypothetical protein